MRILTWILRMYQTRLCRRGVLPDLSPHMMKDIGLDQAPEIQRFPRALFR